MNFKSQREDAGRSDWMESFANNAGLSNELNTGYADDVIKGLEEQYFDTLEASLDDLKTRLGVSKAAMKDIKRIALAKLEGKKKAEAGEMCKLEVDVKEGEEVPGNKEGEPRLVKETEAAVKTAKKPVPEAFKKHIEKMKNKSKDKSKDKKKKAWFQGSTEPTKEGEVTTNDPNKMGYPKEMGYDKKPMETTAPGGQDSRPAEQAAFEGAAAETKKDLGPAGQEFKLKVELQRIPEGEKEANASAKWANALMKAGAKKAAKKVRTIAYKTKKAKNEEAWKKALAKKA
jgi:hypothetical protein